MNVQILPITDVDFSAISPRNLLVQSGERKWANIYSIAFKHWVQFNLVQFSCSVMSDSLRPHESQHARPPCPSQTPRVYSNSCLSSRWCHPAISSSCHPLLLLPPIPPSIRVFSSESTLVVYIKSQLNPWVAGYLRLILHLSNLVEIVS